ncbi:MAG: peptidylprolyl isomerase [Rhodobacteraceae bacterium]|nr:peptidylprolyl isomerase [Paracoccaceae bacterium]
MQGLFEFEYRDAVGYKAAHIVLTMKAGVDFAETAIAKSTDLSGGDLDFFGKGRMVPEFENAVINMDVGIVSARVQTQFDWHVIQRNETQPITTDAARSALAGTLRRAVIKEHRQALVDAADIVEPSLSDIDPEILCNLDLVLN